MPPGDEEPGKTELTLSARSHPSLRLYPMHQLKLSHRGPFSFSGLRVVRYTKTRRSERYSKERERWDLLRGMRRKDKRREKNKKVSQEKMDRQKGQIDLGKDKVGFRCCWIKVRRW